MSMRLLSILLVPLVMVIDWLSKWWTEEGLSLGETVSGAGNWVRLTHGHNSGMAFGLFAGAGRGWLLVAGPICFGLVLWFMYLLRTRQSATWPLALILGGALGNVVDRIPDGRVTDLIDVGIGVHRWPAFNVADAALSVGVIGWWWVLSRPQDSTT